MSTDNEQRKTDMHSSAALNEYKQMGTKVALENADPHQLIQMLFDGALERLNTAKFHIQNNNMARKGESIGKAISIIDGLKVSLNIEKGGDIAKNLESLYDYMQRQLLLANVENRSENIDEVVSLLNEIRSGWSAIPQEVRSNGSQG